MNIYTIKMAFKAIQKNKLVTGINITGLTIGITICILIFSYVRKEYTTDKFLPEFENIYGLLLNETPSISQPVVNIFKDKIPKIEAITYFSKEWAPQVFLMDEEKNKFKIENLMIADSAFFRIFQFKAIWGDPSQALNSANKIVLTKSVSKKIFGNINSVGKTLIYNSTYLQNEIIEVGAVIDDIPHNSSWSFDAILSLQTNYKIEWFDKNRKNFGNNNYSSYFKTTGAVNKTDIEKKLNQLLSEHIPEEYKNKVKLTCLSYKEIYFNAPEFTEQKHGNQFTLSVINITGILILLLACFNYINLVTAQREKRNKTIGIIKTFGAGKKRIIGLISAESLIIIIIVALLVLFLSSLLIPGLNELTGSKFTLTSIFLGWNLCILSGIFSLTFLLTGILPGISFSKYSTTQHLTALAKPTQKKYIRNGFLIFQFVLSIALIASIITIRKQNQYINNFNNGFKKENIIYASTNREIENRIEAFGNELKAVPGISGWTFSSETIGFIKENWGLNININGETKEVNFTKVNVSPNFFDFFDIKLRRGEPFSENSQKNYDFIFNHAAIQEFGIQKLADSRVMLSGDVSKGHIIAEVEDFHFESVHSLIRPIGFMCSRADEVIYLKLNQDNYKTFHQTLSSIEKTWNKFSPNFPFEFRFLDDSWDKLYTKERQFHKIISFITILSILLSCLGLFGLTFFVIEKRTKEIGIRKINGAKTGQVMAMLNKDFIKWVAIAFVIACPIAYYAMNKWLENFAYKTELSWWIFALAGLIALTIALLTVSTQSWRAATRNPVESLRYE